MRSLASIIHEIGERGHAVSASPLERVAAEWAGVVGAALAGLSRPVSLEEGVLHVECMHPGAAMELRIREAEVAGRLAAAAGVRISSLRTRSARRRA